MFVQYELTLFSPFKLFRLYYTTSSQRLVPVRTVPVTVTFRHLVMGLSVTLTLAQLMLAPVRVTPMPGTVTGILRTRAMMT